MREGTPKIRWGDWVAARARIVGFRRQRDLAGKIGCSEDQLSRWIQMAKPPPRMRKGFDGALALVLITTQQILFTDYLSIAPEHATVDMGRWIGPEGRGPWDAKEFSARPADVQAVIVAKYLSDDLQLWLEIGSKLAHAKWERERQHRAESIAIALSHVPKLSAKIARKEKS